MARTRRALVTGTVLLAAVTGWAGTAGASEPGDEDQGRRLFENACSTCHGIGGVGSELGPPVIGSGAAGSNFMLTTGRMPLDNPDSQPVRKPAAFSTEEIGHINAYVASLGPGPEIPDVDPAAGDLVRGQQLYTENCAACHSSSGAGGGVGAGLEAPPLHRSTPEEVVEAIRIGPGSMPRFEEGALSKHDADSIARYLAYLRESPDPGGLGLGRIGPIPEGFVTWLVGVGLLLGICRYIGEKE